MRLASLLLGFVAFATGATSQAVAVPGSGCADGTAVGQPINAIGQPQVGNLTFALAHQCQATSSAAFFLWGSCGTAPLIDWNLSDACFGSWGSSPSSCGNVIGANLFQLDGALTDGGGMVTYPFPLPAIIELVAFTQVTPFCYQFICVELGSPNPCRGVSEGLLVQITP